MPEPKLTCELKFEVAHNNKGVRRYKGTRKTDPVFDACLGCSAYLRRQGIKHIEVPPTTPSEKELIHIRQNPKFSAKKKYVIRRTKNEIVAYLSLWIVSEFDEEAVKKEKAIRHFWDITEANALVIPGGLAKIVFAYFKKKLKRSVIEAMEAP